MPTPPKPTPPPPITHEVFTVDGPLTKCVPAGILSVVDDAFAARFDLYAQAAAPASIAVFSQEGGIIGAAVTTQKGIVHWVARVGDARGAAWFDARGTRTDDGPMLGRPLELSRISSRFGDRFHPITGVKKEHRGVDYAAPTGTPVRAVMDGTVKARATDGSAGNHIKLRHGSMESWYLHLDSFADNIVVGAEIKRGDIIGAVGTTGASTGPHLHYELHLGPVVLDPLDLLPSRTTEALPPTALAAHQARIQAMSLLLRR